MLPGQELNGASLHSQVSLDFISGSLSVMEAKLTRTLALVFLTFHRWKEENLITSSCQISALFLLREQVIAKYWVLSLGPQVEGMLSIILDS